MSAGSRSACWPTSCRCSCWRTSAPPVVRRDDSLRIYRSEKIVPFGFASRVIQGAIFSLVYHRLFAGLAGTSRQPYVWDDRRSVGVDVHHARCRGEAPDDLRGRLHVHRDRLHDPSVHCGRALDGAGVESRRARSGTGPPDEDRCHSMSDLRHAFERCCRRGPTW